MKIRILIAAIVGLMMCSCSSLYHTSSTAAVDTHIYSMAVADVQVSTNKVKKTYTWDYNPFKRVSIETVKSNLTAELLEQNGADVLVEPEFIIEKRGLFRGGSVTAIGFPAKYTNFRKANSDEFEVIKEAMKSNSNKKCSKKFFLF